MQSSYKFLRKSKRRNSLPPFFAMGVDFFTVPVSIYSAVIVFCCIGLTIAYTNSASQAQVWTFAAAEPGGVLAERRAIEFSNSGKGVQKMTPLG